MTRACTHARTHTHTHTHTTHKRAAGSEDAVKEALNVLINVTEKSGNLRNDLWKDILGAVSNLRKEFAKLKCEVQDKNKLILNLEMKASETNSSLRPLEIGCAGVKEATSPRFPVNWKVSDWNVPPSGGRPKKLYSDVVAGSSGNVPHENKMFKLFVKSKNNQNAEYTRALLKSK